MGLGPSRRSTQARRPCPVWAMLDDGDEGRPVQAGRKHAAVPVPVPVPSSPAQRTSPRLAASSRGHDYWQWEATSPPPRPCRLRQRLLLGCAWMTWASSLVCRPARTIWGPARGSRSTVLIRPVQPNGLEVFSGIAMQPACSLVTPAGQPGGASEEESQGRAMQSTMQLQRLAGVAQPTATLRRRLHQSAHCIHPAQGQDFVFSLASDRTMKAQDQSECQPRTSVRLLLQRPRRGRATPPLWFAPKEVSRLGWSASRGHPST
ncbi:hypothetical protein BCR34DRAFT_583897 [Clohesyomyces aquaticus]|uniref:Uncharacterized protein n=1 Tax=Clohesyomyces aquaticus TaxID=1231657 RepID=A0A1Y2A532_9PLEO|nr:hypothetical protein BCR34DRAFT_583897 [Clohesyomyces aquaticus]